MSNKYTVPDFELDDYPLNRASGSMDLLDAVTIYYWEEHYWLAVLKVRSTFGQKPKDSVRVYRWQWKKDRNGNLRWIIDQKFNINKIDIWNDVKKAVEEMFETI
jgi:hypothetical protein